MEKVKIEENKIIARKLFNKELWLCKSSPNNDDKFIKADFCGNISGAFKVLEEMENRGFVWTLSNITDLGSKSDFYWAEFSRESRTVKFGQTLPLAICSAALAAIGEEKNV